MLIYPPSRLYQRGEDRSQGNVEDSTATSVRACNDLGYAAAMLKKHGFSVFLKDYQTQRNTEQDLMQDFASFAPDAVFMSITNATIHKDVAVCARLKAKDPACVIVLKGSIFFDAEQEMLNQINLDPISFLIGGESDFIIADLMDAVFNGAQELSNIGGILYKEGSTWVKTSFEKWHEDLDALEFPDRSLMNNSLYLRPDTQEPQATISTSRGCASACTYCLTPKISGTKVRLRSPKNIYQEILECYQKYNIKNFFFKSDTFTMNKNWVRELCLYIINSELNGKIEWVANSRVNPLEKETLEFMKQAGCWLVAFGFESGNEETLKKIKKGARLEDNLRAARLAKEVGLKVYGFYLIGLPWETRAHIKDTTDLMFKINADFVELHIATPYYGTELYKTAKEAGLINESVLGKDYFNAPTIGTQYLSIDEVQKIKRHTILKYHLRPSYVLAKILSAAARPKILKNYIKFGIKLLKVNLLNGKSIFNVRGGGALNAFGLFPSIHSKAHTAYNAQDLTRLLKKPSQYIAYGNGKSYGDSALASEIIQMKNFDRFLSFEHGVLEAQAGVLLDEILRVFIPQGWFLKVTPGTKLITLGGAIAADVHGKNHHKNGCFSECVEELSLMLPSGEVAVCSRSNNAELFRATCGGMGLTGLILSAKISLEPIRSARITQTVFKTKNLQETLEVFDEISDVSYSAAWIDCLSSGKALGRSVVFAGEFLQDGDLGYTPRTGPNIPFFFPGFALNKLSVSAFNALYYARAKAGKASVGLDEFFYPLDAVGNWNRIYGRGGFVQYQFILPKENTHALQEILEQIAARKEGSFLAVLKLYGKQNANFLSFPLEGYSLALDFKIKPGLFEFLDGLDEIVIKNGGRIYLAKDARVSRQNFEANYPQIADFRELRKDYAMDKKFNSLQSKRLGL